MREKEEALERGISEAASELSIWRSLQEHPGWVLLEKYMTSEKTLRAFAVLNNPIHQAGQVYAQEFMKGEASGLGLIQNFPATQVEVLKIEISKLEVMVEREHDATKAETSVDDGSRIESSEFTRDS